MWGPKQSEAFYKLRDLTSSDTVLAHFDPSLSTQVRQDACKIVISGALTEKHPDGSIRPVAYASRSLSPVEQRYGQTEREALSVVWACERFRFYIHGSQFDLAEDHKPLEVLLNGRGSPSPRIERWRLRLQNYSPRIVYQPGIQNAVDFLSRKPATTNTPRDPVEKYVNSIIIDSLQLSPLKSFLSLPNVNYFENHQGGPGHWELVSCTKAFCRSKGWDYSAKRSYCYPCCTASSHSSTSFPGSLILPPGALARRRR